MTDSRDGTRPAVRPGRTAIMVIDGKKACSKCKEVKPTSEFFRDRGAVSGWSSNCKTCRSMTPVEAKIDAVLWTKYRIRLVDYNRMLEQQDHRCAICTKEPVGENIDKLCVDHNHATGRVRGLLCRECNWGLGKFGDNPDLLMAAAAYLLSEKS